MPSVADIFALALKHHQAGQLAAAEQLYLRILEADPLHSETHFNLGVMLLHQQRYQEAAEHYQQILQLKPDHAEAHYNLGYVLHRQNQVEEAYAHYQEAVRLKPDHVDAQNNLAIAAMEQGRLEQAEAGFREVLRRQPNHLDAINNLGIVTMKQGRLADAEKHFLEAFDLALRSNPRHAQTHLNRAILWLLRGEWTKSWPEYEWRLLTPTFPRYNFRQPRWDGLPLAGRTLLVLAEQGLGDTFNFLRYLPLAQQRGGRVIFQCQMPLRPLLSLCRGLNLVAQGDPLPPFDVYTPLLSLPGILGTTPARVPAPIPYLHADAGLAVDWARQLTSHFALRTSHFLIGIAWQGTPVSGYDRQRSIPLECFEPLTKIHGVRLVSLQKGPGTEQIERMKDEGGRIKQEEAARFLSSFVLHPSFFPIDEASGPFMDTAAIMQNLDLVITADTAIAHLAGALGVPVWVALPLLPDWRWLLDREDSLWYPTMRLFRQTQVDDWDEVFERIAGALICILTRNMSSTITGSSSLLR